MKNTIALVCLMLLYGCASRAEPRFYQGGLYLVGDENCRSVRQLDDSHIICMDRHGNEMGYRTPMTDEQIARWDQQRAAEALAFQEGLQSLSDSVSQAADKVTAASQQISQQRRQSSTPPTFNAPSTNNGGGITYTQVGTSVFGSNGVTYNRIGDTVIGNDGTTCQIVGSIIICN